MEKWRKDKRMPRKSSVKPEIGIKHTGNRSQTVSDSNNVTQTDISGSENIININPPSKSDSVSKIQVSEVANVFTVFGRWLLEHLGFNKFCTVIIISSIISGYFSIDMFTVKLLPQNTQIYITALGIIWLVLTFSICRLYVTRACEKCGRRFALREISETHLGSVKYRGQIHHNIKSVYKCDLCGHEDEKEFVDVEDIDEK